MDDSDEDHEPLPPHLLDHPGFSRTPPPAELPGFDPSESPLSPGGRPTSPAPTPADSSFKGLLSPVDAERPRVTIRVRRQGWVTRRQAARSRFGALDQVRPSSPTRLLAGLDRRGILERSKSKAVRPRFNMRGHL